MKLNDVKERLNQNGYLDVFKQLYVDEHLIEQQKQRYLDLLQVYEELFEEEEVFLFSTPGRTEVSGNHTDHQKGRVLAASVTMDAIAVVSKTEETITVQSDNYSIDPITITDLTKKESEENTSMALIRGVVARFKELGYQYGGFNAAITSSVLKGSGISSSAAFEVLIGTILNHLYNDGRISPIEIAQIGQYAENVYFNKPSGLMDQMACSVGGFVAIDFKDTAHPVVEPISFNLAENGYKLCLVDTGGNHADLSSEYGSMVIEMKEVAHFFKKEVLREVEEQEFYRNLANLRDVVSDRAILRAYHFFHENKRVVQIKEDLENNDIAGFKRHIIESGYSSFMYLQNVYSTLDVYSQGLSVALALSEDILKEVGAYRVHGGGLAGTIQAFVPNDLVEIYQKTIEEVFGIGKCHVLAIRPVGSVLIP